MGIDETGRGYEAVYAADAYFGLEARVRTSALLNNNAESQSW